MALAYVAVTGTWDDGSGQPVTGTVTFTPSETVYSAGQQVVTPAAPVSCPVVNGRLLTASGGPVQLLATDNTGLTLMGRTGFWFWTASVNIGGGVAGKADSFSFFLPYSGSPVDLYSLANQVLSDFPNPLTALGDLMAGGAGGSPQRLAGNTTSAREFLVSQGTGSAAQAPAWGALQAGDIPSLPYLAPNGSGAALTGITPAQAGADASGAAAAVLASSAQKSANLSDLASASTARTNLGLGSAAVQNTSAFDAAGAASAAQAASLQKSSNLSDLASVATARVSLGLPMFTGTGTVVNAASAAQLAWINANGLPGYATLPSPALTAMAGDNSTNDQTALAHLVTYLGAAYASSGYAHAIYCPAGTYAIHDNGTVWASGVSLIGDGPALTVFNLSNPVNTTNPVPLAVFTVSGQSAGTANYLADCQFRDFTIDGSGVSLASYTTGPKGLGMQFMVRPVFRNLVIQNCGASGLGCDHLVDAQILNVKAYNNGRLNNGTQAGGAGFGIGTGGWAGTAFAEGGDVIGCTARGNGTHGLFFEAQYAVASNPRPVGWRVIGGRYEGNQFGISDWGCDGLITTGAHLVNNLQHGFNVSAASTVVAAAGVNGVIDGCVVDGNGLDGICLGDTALYKVGGLNRISNNGRHGVHYLNIVNSASTAMACMSLSDAEIWGHGRSGVYVDAALSNPFWLSNRSRNNGIASAAAASNSGGTVTYGALTVTDSAASWVVNGHTGKTVTVGALTAVIKSNTATVLTLWPTFANGTTAWGTSGTPASGTGYSVPAAAADRAAFTVNQTLSHPNIRDNRGWDDNGTRIQPYGIVITASGALTSGQVSDNDFLGNLTASNLFTTLPSGGTWMNNAGIPGAELSTPTAMLTDGPGQFTGYVQPGNGSAAGAHEYSGSGAPNISGSVAGDYYFRTDTPSIANQRIYVATGANTWSGIL